MAKFCKYCGATLQEDNPRCPECGASVQTAQPEVTMNAAPEQTAVTAVPEQVAVPAAPQQPVFPAPGQGFPPPPGTQPAQTAASAFQNQVPPQYNQQQAQFGQPPLPQEPYHMGKGGQMKWFKFQIYFLLFVNALMQILNAFSCLSEKNAAVELQTIPGYAGTFATYGTICTIFIAIYVALAVYAIVVRFLMAKFRRGAIMHFFIQYIASSAVTILFNTIMIVTFSKLSSIFANDALNQLLSNTTSQTISTLSSLVVGTILHAIYYKKRSHLFVN